MIPKVIHYCWFGKGELPALARSCITSWESVMPDYEIVRWDESNFDYESCAFAKAAYEKKAWAFVSDYARFTVIHEHGGLYFDTDVEVLRPFDELLDLNAFAGFAAHGAFVNPGLVLGATVRHPLFAEVADTYRMLAFHEYTGRNYSLEAPRIFTKLLEENHSLKRDGRRQDLPCGVTTAPGRGGMAGREKAGDSPTLTVLPASFFDPFNPHTGTLRTESNTFSVHHYAGSWLSPARKYRMDMRKKLAPMVGGNLSWFLSSTFSILKFGKRAL